MKQLSRSKVILYKTILLCFLVVSNHVLMAQSDTNRIDDIINIQFNHLIFPDGEEGFESLKSKFNQVANDADTKINIVHIGGSHIQHGVFTNTINAEIMKNMESSTPSRGMIFPNRIAKTNTPMDFWIDFDGNWTHCKSNHSNTQCAVGLSAMKVNTSDSKARIKIYPRSGEKKQFYAFDRIRLIMSENSHDFTMKINDKTMDENDIRNSEIKLGLAELTDTFKLDIVSLKRGGNIGIEGIIFENSKSVMHYHGMGLNGAHIQTYLNCSQLDRDLDLLHADMVVLSLGLNDIIASDFDQFAFVEKYSQLIKKIRKSRPGIPIILTTSSDHLKKGKQVNENSSRAATAFYMVAVMNHTAVWDWLEIMGGRGCISSWVERDLAKKDYIHFTDQGYELLGELFAQAMLNYFIEEK